MVGCKIEPVLNSNINQSIILLNKEQINITCNEGYETTDNTKRTCIKAVVIPSFKTHPINCVPKSYFCY